MSKDTIINPLTGRRIKIGGYTHKKLIKDNIYFKPESNLSQSHQKYCRCIAKVAARNPEWCNRHGKWKMGAQGCYNPYAICTKSTKRTGQKRCLPYFDLENMTYKEVKALADMKGKTVEELMRNL